jgi:hypothetical protein
LFTKLFAWSGWDAIAAIGQTLGAIATFVAVWVSVKVAREAQKTAQDVADKNFRPSISIKPLPLNPDERKISYTITNFSQFPVPIKEIRVVLSAYGEEAEPIDWRHAAAYEAAMAIDKFIETTKRAKIAVNMAIQKAIIRAIELGVDVRKAATQWEKTITVLAKWVTEEEGKAAAEEEDTVEKLKLIKFPPKFLKKARNTKEEERVFDQLLAQDTKINAMENQVAAVSAEWRAAAEWAETAKANAATQAITEIADEKMVARWVASTKNGVSNWVEKAIRAHKIGGTIGVESSKWEIEFSTVTDQINSVCLPYTADPSEESIMRGLEIQREIKIIIGIAENTVEEWGKIIEEAKKNISKMQRDAGVIMTTDAIKNIDRPFAQIIEEAYGILRLIGDTNEMDTTDEIANADIETAEAVEKIIEEKLTTEPTPSSILLESGRSQNINIWAHDVKFPPEEAFYTIRTHMQIDTESGHFFERTYFYCLPNPHSDTYWDHARVIQNVSLRHKEVHHVSTKDRFPSKFAYLYSENEEQIRKMQTKLNKRAEAYLKKTKKREDS